MSERDDDAFVRELLEKAGKRPEVPAKAVAEIIDATRAVWQKNIRAQRVRRALAWTLPIAAALTIGFVLLWQRAQRTPPIVATVIRTDGLLIASGTGITAGSWIDLPADATATLSVGRGASLRLHGSTRVQLVSADVMQLEYGQAYLDCPPAATDVTVRTAAGDFAPAGTQFEVRIDRQGGTELRVREGVVRLKRSGGEASARAGEQFIVTPGGKLLRGAVLPYDASWRWVEGVAPMIEIEGKPLLGFLKWIAREKGQTLAFSDDRAAAASATIILHGSIANMTVDEALQTIAMGSGFTVREENGVLRIDGL